MTEADWLGSVNPVWMMKQLWRVPGRPYPITMRKQRLLWCAGLRRIWHLLPKGGQASTEAVERYADGHVGAEELSAARLPHLAGRKPAYYAVMFAAQPSASVRGLMETVLTYCAQAGMAVETLYGVTGDPESVAQSHLVRDVFPNPFRPVSLGSSLTAGGLVRGLAQAGYDERQLPAGTLDPVRIAVLADALEEAGCTDEAVVSHLRSPGPHVRGCWVVDRLLERD